jgi:hypothetical protein
MNTRAIMPVICQDDVFPGTGSQFGLGDINLSLFFSPKQPTAGSDNRPDINNTFMQPFVARTWPSAWTLSFQSETSYNWETKSGPSRSISPWPS